MTKGKPKHFEEFIHHSKLFWQVTSIFTVAVGVLLFQEKEVVSANIFGFFLTGVLVYFAVSFRILKQEALARAIKAELIIPNKPHLDQWNPYLLVWWSIGVLYLWNLLEIIGIKIWAVAVFSIFFSLWTCIIYCISRYDKTKNLKDALERAFPIRRNQKL